VTWRGFTPNCGEERKENVAVKSIEKEREEGTGSGFLSQLTKGKLTLPLESPSKRGQRKEGGNLHRDATMLHGKKKRKVGGSDDQCAEVEHQLDVAAGERRATETPQLLRKQAKERKRELIVFYAEEKRLSGQIVVTAQKNQTWEGVVHLCDTKEEEKTCLSSFIRRV